MPRNCDVGTPEEQRERFEKFCSKYETRHEGEAYCSKRCPLSKCDTIILCVLKWAQLPFGGKGGIEKGKRNTEKVVRTKKTEKSKKEAR
jgi:hypothetical protein